MSFSSQSPLSIEYSPLSSSSIERSAKRERETRGWIPRPTTMARVVHTRGLPACLHMLQSAWLEKLSTSQPERALERLVCCSPDSRLDTVSFFPSIVTSGALVSRGLLSRTVRWSHQVLSSHSLARTTYHKEASGCHEAVLVFE